jgi:spoIIIJ-associated protein
MKEVKMKGRTVDDAVEGALQVLGAKKEDVDIKILNEGRGGILGVFGGEEAEVLVSTKEAIGEVAKGRLQEILDKAGLMTIVSLVSEEGESVSLEIKGEDMGRIIGKDGAMLGALEIIMSAILSREAQGRIFAHIEASGYQKKREEKLKETIGNAIKDALEKGQEVILPPMDPKGRREVHIIVKEDGRMSSYSRGEGAERRVVISPKRNEEG